MISALTGELVGVDESRVEIQSGAIRYEVLVPAADVSDLQQRVGDSITLHTIFYLEGDAARGNLEPRLIGFLRARDRRFFERFTTVKGIGTKTALRALQEPVGAIAHAIERRDARYLVRLPGIGKRTAELIVAELAGKVQEFAYLPDEAESAVQSASQMADYEEDAVQALMALGERRPDAERLLERVRQAQPDLRTTEQILREMLKFRTART